MIETPTINEIIYNRPRKASVSTYTTRPNKYHHGECVKFHFGRELLCGLKENKAENALYLPFGPAMIVAALIVIFIV